MEGGGVQIKMPSGWEDFEDGHEPMWADGWGYRIKPEPEYVPLESEDWIKDGPWWIKPAGKDDAIADVIVRVSNNGIGWGHGHWRTHENACNLVRRNSTSDWMPCKKLKQ